MARHRPAIGVPSDRFDGPSKYTEPRPFGFLLATTTEPSGATTRFPRGPLGITHLRRPR